MNVCLIFSIGNLSQREIPVIIKCLAICCILRTILLKGTTINSFVPRLLQVVGMKVFHLEISPEGLEACGIKFFPQKKESFQANSW